MLSQTQKPHNSTITQTTVRCNYFLYLFNLRL